MASCNVTAYDLGVHRVPLGLLEPSCFYAAGTVVNLVVDPRGRTQKTGKSKR